jgi:hypothetical protein
MVETAAAQKMVGRLSAAAQEHVQPLVGRS